MTTATIPAMNLEAERAALGGVLLGGVTVFRALGVPTSAFFPESHRAIHRAMLRLVDRGDALDTITVQNELARANELDVAGGPAALALLVEEGPIAVNAPSYARIIAEHAQRREYDAPPPRPPGARGPAPPGRAALGPDPPAPGPQPAP